MHEGFESADDDRKYPQCVAGETLRWAGGAFDPAAFNPAAVTFDDPKKRWKKAFERRP